MAGTASLAGQKIRQFLQAIVLAVVALYFGREILMPLAMAVLLSFLLSPVVTWLEKHGLHRVPAVVLVIAIICCGLAGSGYLVLRQMATLAQNIDEYKENLIGKAKSLRPSGRSLVEEVPKAIDDVVREATKDGEEPAGDATTGEAPRVDTTDVAVTAIEVIDDDDPSDGEQRLRDSLASLESQRRAKESPGRTDGVRDRSRGSADDDAPADNAVPVRLVPNVSTMDTLGQYIETFMTPLANLAIITVLVIFMLIQREDLRNRLVRLAGKRLTLTTRTLDEVGSRISRYLLMLALVNGSFGAAVTVGLLLIGVHYAFLWGALAAALRFVPYVGPVLAASLPIAMSVAQFPADDWFHPSLTVALILVLELISNNVIEPLAYGRSTGVSVVALLVAATFWTWVWGPIGLMLSVPMTVVLAVLGEHVPALEPLGVLLGDKPALAPYMTYYQRLLAGDFDEAAAIFEEHRRTHSLQEDFDHVLVPALVMAERDYARGDLPADDQKFVWQCTRDLVEESLNKAAIGEDGLVDATKAGLRAKVVACSAHDQADDLALTMLSKLLNPHGGSFEIMGVSLLASELIAAIQERSPDAVCISSLGPVGGRQTRYLCKRIRQHFPKLRIVVGRWGFRGDKESMVRSLKGSGADQVATGLDEARDMLERIMPVSHQEGVAGNGNEAVATSTADRATRG